MGKLAEGDKGCSVARPPIDGPLHLWVTEVKWQV